MEKYIIFSLMYLSMQNILMGIEYNSFFVNMMGDIQNKPFDATSTNDLFIRNLVVYFVVYGAVLYILNKYIVDSVGLLEAFIFGTAFYLVCDFPLLVYFQDTIHHFKSLLFDTIVLGGLGVVIPLYLTRHFTPFLSKNILGLLLLFIITMIYMYHYSYTTTQQKLKEYKEKQKVT